MVKWISQRSSKPSFQVRILVDAPKYRGGIMSKCKHCNKEFDISDKPNGWMANHSRWCEKNPKRDQYRFNSKAAVSAMNSAKRKNGHLNQYSKARLEGKPIPESSQKGKRNETWVGRKHTEKTKQILREKALSSKHRRLKRGIIDYNGILLDSTWELALAKRLDEKGILWIRPNPLPWIDDEGITHNYFPDFYLIEYDMYLDPKNSQAVKVQKKKLNCLLSQYKNIIILDTLDKCKNFSLYN